MNDLEITRLCAEAMGLKTAPERSKAFSETASGLWCDGFVFYDPLHDDAQAMALMKKFPGACLDDFDLYVIMRGMDAPMDLNRAICECVAKMDGAK